MADVSDLPEVLVSFLASWDMHDVEALADHWSEDSVLIDPADPLTGGEIVQGREAMRSYYRRLFEEIPDAKLEGCAAIEDERGLAWLWRYSGSTDGRTWTVAGASYFRLDPDGLILSDNAVWDPTVLGRN
jgi:ketosteroid isomerase-like protein